VGGFLFRGYEGGLGLKFEVFAIDRRGYSS